MRTTLLTLLALSCTDRGGKAVPTSRDTGAENSSHGTPADGTDTADDTAGGVEDDTGTDPQATEDSDTGEPVIDALSTRSCAFRQEGGKGPHVLCMALIGDAFAPTPTRTLCSQFDDLYADQLGAFVPSQAMSTCPSGAFGGCAIHPREGEDQVWFFYVSGGDAVCAASGGVWVAL